MTNSSTSPRAVDVASRPVWCRVPNDERGFPTEVIVWDHQGVKTIGLRRNMPPQARMWARLTMGITATEEALTMEELLGADQVRMAEPRMDPTVQEQEDDCFCLFPIQYPKLWEMYQRSKAVFWVPDEIDFAQDIKDFEALSPRERRYIELVLAFFASADNLVMTNLGDNFLHEVKIPEVRQFYAFQEGIEAIHAETYNLSIDTLVRDPGRKRELFRAIHSVRSIHAKASWVKYWIGNPQISFAYRLLAFACVEGIFFSSSFCALFWLRSKGVMPGLTLSNEFISRDEGLHTEFACELYREMGAPLPEPLVHALVAEAVFLEDRFVDEALPSALLGMNAASMKEYIRFVADWLLTRLGYSKLFLQENPFPFMDMISLQGKTNFFEKKVSDYSKISSLNGMNDQTQLTFDADF